MNRELEQSLRLRMEGKQSPRPGEQKSKEQRVSEVVSKMPPGLRWAVYDQIVEQGFGDE